MNLELVENRIKLISDEMSMIKARYATLEGHLFEANHWKTELLKKDAENDEVDDKSASKVTE